MLISNAASFFALLYLYKLVEHEYNRHVAHRAVFYVSIFPTAIFFSAVYTESLFLFLTVASFYYIRERRWVLAGVFGFFAALTRVEGVLLDRTVPDRMGRRALRVARRLVQVAGRYGRQAADRRGARPARARDLHGVPVGAARRPALLLARAGALGPLPRAAVGELQPLAAASSSGNYPPQTIANQLLEVTFTLLMLAVLVIGFRRLRASYIAYMAVSILVPLSTSSLMSMPRFALVLFPMFALFGLWGAKPTVNNTIVAFSLPLLGLFTVLFADWYWVA